jgi:hypothetical protein
VSSKGQGNRQFGLWFAAIFFVPGGIAILIAVVTWYLPLLLWGGVACSQVQG